MNKTDKTMGKVTMEFNHDDGDTYENIVWGRIIRTQTNMLLRKVDSLIMIMMMLSKVDTAFKMFDKNKDGFITKEEFAQVGM